MEHQKDNQIAFPDLELVFVEGGSFTMGDNESKYNFEKPAHQVAVASFYMGRYPVTQRLWQAVMDKNPSMFQGEMRPVEQVSWDDAQVFIEQLNAVTGKTFRLPTEAQWEYAARGGKYSQGYTFAGSDKLKQVGWYDENSNGETHDVGLLLANELDIYDLSGNVREWCEDDYHPNYEGAPKDGSAWIDTPRGEGRVLRGGSNFHKALHCRSTFRRRYHPADRRSNFGFRLVLPFQSVG
ncbi:MAG: formylglycine-generating enzyme family protein [Burkholderiales bacterium]|nr:formylglycine-generating enzyme family protein [Burkholderiales bacterium]